MWELYAVGMYLASVVMYLLIRSVKKNIHPQAINFFMFLPGTVFLLIFALLRGENLLIDILGVGLVFVATFFFSYLGNTASLKALEEAPNSGYSLVIQKSYALWTSIAAVLLFSSELSADKFVAILISVGFLFLVAKNDKKIDKKLNGNWLFQSFLAFMLFGSLSLFSKYMLNEGYTPIQLTFYVFLSNIIIQGAINRTLIVSELGDVSKSKWGILIIIGILSALFNLFMRLAIEEAPNVGYVSAINASSIAAVTIFSKLIFKDELSLVKFIGIIGGILAVVYILL